MNDNLKYKGFSGSVNFSLEDLVFFGKIDRIDDLITFEGMTIDELENAFKFVVDLHIQDCNQ